ncbi:MAG: amidase family protein [Paracoccaceae bacterium]|nr:amidase family protein [Paracoccaceae bacterium]
MLKAGEVSPSELLEAAWQRMDQVETAVNATVIRDDPRARAALARLPDWAAQNGEHRGWLAGLPVGIKDLIAVAGMRGTAGSAALAEFVAPESDALIERLEARGAIIAGKTNTPEFGAGGNTFNAVFGATRNPWDTGRNAGGSSGGAAVSLATGEVWLSHGSDLAGSLRTPAAFCGVIGLRPSPGRAGGAPVDTGFAFEAVQGPMARDIRDTALFLDAMAGYDARHPLSIAEPAVGFQAALDQPPGPIRIAFSEDQGGFAPVEAPIRAVSRSAMQAVSGEGVTVEEACPDLPGLAETYTTLRGMHYASVTARLPDHVRAHFKPTLVENTAHGLSLTPEQIFDAQRQRTVLYHAMRTFLQGYDVLAIPVTGIAPGPVEQEYPPFVDGQPVNDYVEWLRFSFLAPTTTLPALSMPAGFTAEGLPVGLQLIGPPRGEARLLQVALAVEERLALGCSPIDPVVR